MFSKFISVLLLVAPLASALITLNAISGVVTSGGSITVTWSSSSLDPAFQLELINLNKSLNIQFVIAIVNDSLVQGSDLTLTNLTFTLPVVPEGYYYVFEAVNVGNVSQIYSTTPSFLIGATVSGAGSGAAPTAVTGTCTSTNTPSGSSSGAATTALTGTSTSTNTPTASNLPVTTSTSATGVSSSSVGTGTGTPTTTTSTSSKELDVEGIAGCVVGGIAMIVAVLIAFRFLRRHKESTGTVISGSEL